MTINERFQVSTPEEQGISSNSITQFIDECESKGLELHSIMLLRHGYKIAEGWWNPYTKELRRTLFSLSKTFTATAVGIVVDKKLISLEDKVISFFPDDLPETVSENLKEMKIRHLLTMTTGHEDFKFGRNKNWVKEILKEPVRHEPGTHFYYDSSASYLLSAIIQKVTGMTLLEYIEPLIMQPLGIKGATWDKCPSGINTGAFGLKIKTADIAVFGQMLLNKGTWNGVRIISEKWINEAFSSYAPEWDSDSSDWHKGYGYQIWMAFDGYAAVGSYGQLCVVLPEKDAIMVVTSAIKDASEIMSIIWEHINDNMVDALPNDSSAYENLMNKLDSLSLKTVPVNDPSLTIQQINGSIYIPLPDFADKKYSEGINRLIWDSFSILFEEGKYLISYWVSSIRYDITCGQNQPVRSTVKSENGEEPVESAGTWTDTNTFYILKRFLETPFNQKITCEFINDRIKIAMTNCIAERVISEYIFEGTTLGDELRP